MVSAPVSATRVPIWRNVRVLQWIFQLLVLLFAVLVLAWLWGNYQTNSERLNIPTDLGYLDNPAAFEITGNSMSQNAPVRTALYEGFLNTLRISVAGIIAATLLGTIVGIARLSQNWLVSKIATVYVEAVRNVPLAIFVVAGLSAIVFGVLPNIQEAWDLGFLVASNRGIAVPWFEGGTGGGLLLLGLAAAAVAWGVARWRRSVSERTGEPPRSGLFAGGAFVVAMIVGWFALGYSATLPNVDGRRTAGGIRVDPSFFALFFALVVYTASHIAEIVRGSIQSVPKGQGEAASALALSGFQRMINVILPQAFRVAIPPLGNQYLNLIKNSSLGAAIGYYDLTLVTQTTVGNGSPAIPAFALTMVIYIGISLFTSVFVNIANRRLALVER